VHGVVTVGSPHHGTWLGRFGHAPNAQQVRWQSRWLLQLAAAEPAQRYRRFTCFWGHCDNIVFPASTATLPVPTTAICAAMRTCTCCATRRCWTRCCGAWPRTSLSRRRIRARR
jgi:hypothetical protein